MLIKNSSDTIGNETRDLPTSNTVPQPTAPPRGPILEVYLMIIPINSPPKTWCRNESNKYSASGLSHIYCTVQQTRFSSANIVSPPSASVELIMTDVVVRQGVSYR